MKKIIFGLYLLFCLVLVFYVALPNFDFPKPPPDSVQSKEPADMEDSLRQAYFTNYSRAEVLEWYESQFRKSPFLGISLPTYLLNYPPEESQSIIRDQTRSTFLQEIVHPFRETVFVNGYEPAKEDDKNKIIIDGVRWRQKIIVKYIPTNVVVREIILLAGLVSFPVLFIIFGKLMSSLRGNVKNIATLFKHKDF
ncbi:MAG: hypothetical protein GYA60_10480 [Candidatus Methanofastidiosa archaeon]|nr:hypothetical protein [Candidatus Methanofastidiosa archaeon]